MVRVFIRLSIFIWITTLLLIIGIDIVSERIPPASYGTLWTPRNFRGHDNNLSLIDFRTGVSNRVQIPPLANGSYIYLPSNSNCQLTYLQIQNNGFLRTHILNMTSQSWDFFELPFRTLPNDVFFVQRNSLWSPDDSALYLDYHSQYFILDTQSTEYYQLPQLLRNATWSPNSRYLAGTSIFAASRLSIFDRETRTIEYYDLSDFRWLSWSPDSRYIAGVKHNGISGYTLQILDLETKIVSKVLDDMPLIVVQGNDESMLSWSPDNSQIAFIGQAERLSALRGTYVQTYVVDIADGKRQELSSEPILWQQNWQLTWSPDSTRLTYFAPSGERDNAMMYIYDFRKEENLDLVPLALYNMSENQFWSPDSRYLAVIDSRLRLRAIDTLDYTTRTIDIFVNHIYGWQDEGSLAFLTGLYDRREDTRLRIAHMQADNIQMTDYTIPIENSVRIGICERGE